MADVAKLKKKAAEFELKKQFDKALAAYVEILDTYGRKNDQDVDLALYNRVGDLFLRQGNVADAVDYYEQAVDRYTEGGFFNNAIALCNKILRNSPGRASVYYKLGKISAHKGFKGDAKANFLEYADRMQKSGKIDESFRALKEFADLCPDQDDIRLMLADQLSKKGRGKEAVEQLQMLHARYVQEGRDTEARATIERMKSIDPASQPLAAGDAPRRVPGDLVFLDLDDTSPRAATPAAPPRPVAPAAPKPAAPAPSVMDRKARRATAGLDIIATGDHPDVPPPPPARAAAPPAPAPGPESVPEIEMMPEPAEVELETVELEMYEPPAMDDMTGPADFDHSSDAAASTNLLDGLQTTSFDAGDSTESGSLLDLDSGGFDEPAAPPPPRAAPRPAPAAPAAAPPADMELGGDLLDFEIPDQRHTGPREVAPREVLRTPAQPPAAVSRPTFDDLPMLDDGPSSGGNDLELIMPEDDVVAPPAPAARRPVARPVPPSPKPAPPRTAPPAPPAPAPAARRRPEPQPVDDIPLMDLDLPMPGEATASITGSPTDFGSAFDPADDLEMIDLSAPMPESSAYVEPEPYVEQDVELSPAELDVRAELDLDVPPIAREESGAFAVVSDGMESSGDFESVPAAPRRSSTMIAARSVEMLQAMVESEPEDFTLRRQLGEAMLESGDREGGLRELEAAMIGFERTDDLGSAASLADEIVLLNPNSVRHHQKRVEYAFRTNERGRLIEAYLQLADALLQADQVEKSRAIYQRVIDLSPDDLRANAALESFPAEEKAPEPPPAPKGRQSAAMPRPAAPLKPIVTGDDEFVNLGDWLRDDVAPKDTRMVVEEKEPTGDEEADFQDMLRKFKQGIAENVEDEDHQSHYDLGVAYKEMGLLDEAIAEFQKALRGPANRASTYEALGQCFIEKEQYPMAATILGRALQEKGVTDDQLVGVLYLLGMAAEQRGQLDQASQYYQRVFVVDIQFRDVGDRLAAVEGAL